MIFVGMGGSNDCRQGTPPYLSQSNVRFKLTSGTFISSSIVFKDTITAQVLHSGKKNLNY